MKSRLRTLGVIQVLKNNKEPHNDATKTWWMEKYDWFVGINVGIHNCSVGHLVYIILYMKSVHVWLMISFRVFCNR